MATLPPVPRVIKAVINYEINLVPACNVFHVQYSAGTPTPAQMNLIAQNIHGYWSQNFIPNVTASTLLLNCICQDLSSQFGAQGEHATAIPGTATGASLPSSTAIVGSWLILNRYRGGKPRTYVSGLPQSDLLDPQHFAASTVTTYQASFQGFLNSVNGMSSPSGVGPFALGCVHYRKNLEPLATPYFDPFAAVNVKNNVGSQRGRLT